MAQKSSTVPLPPLVGMAVGAVLVLTGAHWSTTFQAFLAVVVLCIGLISYSYWKGAKQGGLPVYALIVFALWNSYGPPSLLGIHESVAFFKGRAITTEATDLTMFVLLLGVLALGLGMVIPLPSAVRKTPAIVPTSLTYLRGAVLVSIFLSLVRVGGGQLQGGLAVLQTQFPLVTVAISYQAILQGISAKLDKLLCGALVATIFARGLSSGWMGPVVAAALVLGLVYVLERRRIPWQVVTVVFLVMAFLQPGKSDYRKTYWGESQSVNAQDTGIARIGFWLSTSYTRWRDALLSPSGDQTVRSMLSDLERRQSLLDQTANVIQMTPSLVPYQGVTPYMYLAAAGIPRVLWPNKPSMNEANRFYQRTYLHANDSDIRTSISVGFLTEAYMSAGIPGVVFILVLIGIMLNLLRQICLRPDSGSLLQALGIVLLLNFLQVESQASVLFSNIFQVTLVVFVAYYPVLRRLRVAGQGQFWPQRPLASPRLEGA